ncbi:acyl-CoA--6-aminopenicillanic acid acyltransferase [Virgibacillus profundi]|uniref:Acyl-CoA--6-aminopenicillanic acid acyltransferase n=1 Tax=Virgibacillus profundi TaxID=2024555 RepID=A0A2A2IB77_9BACI|nr:C45 family peptidase [Virgibacillus profundi]PAV28877.1 acyl-CoA--6-aminopenicillanic acid acyltransferase [Virgibacillus profundi]PXY53045.1 linear amide C-N hydrolase [Virgibacillus profundi]
MTKVFSDIIQFRGNHYDFGYMQGELLRNSPILPARKKQWDKQWRHFLFEKNEVQQAFSRFAPAIWEELHGLADALSMDMEDAIREFGGYYYEYGRSGCSIFSDSDYMVRNYDNEPISYEGRYLLYEPTDSGYAVIGPSMQITGRTDGMNEKGLVMGYNFINRKKSDDGFVCNMIGRIILENCANVDKAISLLKEIPHRHSFNYALLDQTGASIVVEASPRSVTFHKANICTNHFEQLTDENRYRMDDSIQRQQKMEKQQGNITDPYKAFRMLNDTDKGIFSKKYGAWAGTLHTAVYLPKEMKTWIALGGDRWPLILDFQKWLNGNKLSVKRIKGELDSTNSFINE